MSRVVVVSEGHGFDRQEFVKSVVIAERECAFEGCSSAVSATYSRVRQISVEPRRVSYEMVWACDEHKEELVLLARQDRADGLIDGGVLVTGWTQELVGGCLATNCDAGATHAVFVARDYGPHARRMEAISLCGPHAVEIERGLPHASSEAD